MPRHRHYERVYQPIGEPPAGTYFVGYARYSSIMQDAATIAKSDFIARLNGD